jgi:hypothetical protein
MPVLWLVGWLVGGWFGLEEVWFIGVDSFQ